MKKIKLFFATVFCLSLLLVPAWALADDTEPSLDAPLADAGPAFLAFSGVVKEITPFVDADGKEVAEKYYLLLEGEEEALMNFVITEETYLVTKTKPEKGLKVTGYYRANMPAILIYPPQQPAVVLAVKPDEKQVFEVDHFNEELVSDGNTLKITSTTDTEIVNPDGTAFTGEIKNRDLVVFFTVATSSIPAQTTPEKIVVLPVFETSPVEGEVEPETPELTVDVSQMDIVVENKIIEAPPAYTTEDGVVMVPLRAIAEALGYTVQWDPVLRSVMVNNTMNLVIGQDYYTFARMAPITLGTAPELHNALTYVPLSFFKQVAQLNNAYVFEGQIVIDNGEEMY